MEILISVSSLIIALCAIGLTIWQLNIQREHNKISVKPHLFRMSKRDKVHGVARLQVDLINNGLGPAYIDKFQVFYKSQSCEPEAVISEMLGALAVDSSITILGDDYALAQKESVTLMSVVFPAKAKDDISAVSERIDKLDLLIEYSSAYEKMEPLDTRDDK